MQKFDFSNFDVAKLFDIDSALTKLEEGTKSATALITDKKARDLVETIYSAGFEFARAQAVAAKTYGEAVKKAVKV